MMHSIKFEDIVVTGGTGFIGKALCSFLRGVLPAGSRIMALGSSDVDLTEQTASFEYFRELSGKIRCSHIFHLAALYKPGDWSVLHPATQFSANMAMNLNLLESWYRFFPRARLTSALSYGIYSASSRRHSESEILSSSPEESLFAYAETKKALLIGQRAYAKEHDMSSACVVLPTVYGPGDSFEENAHVMGALIGKFVRATINKSPTVGVWGDGTQKREFLFVDDAAQGLYLAATKSKKEVLNLGTSDCQSIKNIVRLIAKATGYSGKIKFERDRFAGTKRRQLDVRALKKELKWLPQTELKDGIQKTVEWYLRMLTQDKVAA